MSGQSIRTDYRGYYTYNSDGTSVRAGAASTSRSHDRHAQRIIHKFKLDSNHPPHAFITEDLSDSEPLEEDWTTRDRERDVNNSFDRMAAENLAKWGTPPVAG